MKNILIFLYEEDFGTDIRVFANNEIDLREFLLEKGYTDINFSDLESFYGTCSFRDQYGIQVAKCFYIASV